MGLFFIGFIYMELTLLGNLPRSTLTLSAGSNTFKVFVVNSNSPMPVSLDSSCVDSLPSAQKWILDCHWTTEFNDHDFFIRHWISNMPLIHLCPVEILKEIQWDHSGRTFLLLIREWRVYFHSHCWLRV